ncbi:hypothetical protein CHS0354_000709 [Potamilus streckersoni]|uniref:Oxidoreductase n=1 Tax=Potamilus streckersoni TaxID=2493646 RepID=A0AAE0T7U0_9BIVA|nr:hypothetical protein CHS0354_000709 [Potamilus streckersoni]
MGMIGGGEGSFIGAIHRAAIGLDGLIELAAGAFSSNPDTALISGQNLFLNNERIYSSFESMIKTEASLPKSKRIDFVSIVTPNHIHFEPAKLALEHGFHVVIEKPFTFTLDEALHLRTLAKEKNLLLCVTHTYSGYPLVKEARSRVANGCLGKIRKIYVEYPQGWLSTPLELTGNKQASWRTNPNTSGKGGALGDIGTHAAHLAQYISGLKITAVCADVQILVPNRQLDDDIAVLLKFQNEASGVLVASQIATGEENNLKIKIYGEAGGLEWRQHEPNSLTHISLDKPTQIIRSGSNFTNILSPSALHACRTPSGHPEGYIEAFANIYKNFALTLRATLNKEEPNPIWLDFPNADDGVFGKVFFGFPPWRMPFGGHQQVCKSPLLCKLPYFHLLPKPLYKFMLKTFGEMNSTVLALMEVRETKLSIASFQAMIRKSELTIIKETLYLINPNYDIKFGLRPQVLPAFLNIPFFKDFFTTAYYGIAMRKDAPV